MRDIIFDLIDKEKERQATTINLIASESIASENVMKAMGSILGNRYSEGYPGKKYYGGQEYLNQIEQIAIDRAKEIFGAEYVNVQPLSGSPANLAIYMAVLKPGDTVLGFDLACGGHLSHGHKLSSSGILYNFISYGVDKETHLIDMDELERLAIEHKPKMIIAGFSAYSRDLDWKRFRSICDKVGCILMADISHIAGLIAGGQLENPVPICDIVMTTTHKIGLGVRGAIIMSKEKYADSLNRGVFPGVQGGPHMSNIAAKAIAFKEVLSPEFKKYTENIIINANVLSTVLKEDYGFKIITGGTDNHIILIDVFSSSLSAGLDGKTVEVALEKVGITVNKNMIPYDTRSPFSPSGIRIGTTVITAMGATEADMYVIANLIAETIRNIKDESRLEIIKKEVLDFCLTLKKI